MDQIKRLYYPVRVFIERRRNVLQLPRAAFFHMRTIELFRSCGIEAEVRAQSEKEFTPEGAVVAVFWADQGDQANRHPC